MDDTYFTGYDNGYGYSARHGSPNMSDPNHGIILSQQDVAGQDALSPAMHYRHDALTSPSPTHPLHCTIGQQQADFQPCDATVKTNPHIHRIHSYQTHAMSRGASKLSNHSSTSSGQQLGGHQPYAQDSFQDSFPSSSINMLRSASDTPFLHSQFFNFHHSGSQLNNTPSKSFVSPLINVVPTGFSATPQHGFSVGHTDDMATDWDWSSIAGLDTFENTVAGFGQTTTKHNRYFPPLAPLAPQNRQRPRAVSFGYPPRLTGSFALTPDPASKREISSVAPSASPSTSSPETTPPAKKRRRHHNLESDSEPDIITGHVLASGRFKCSEAECSGLRFGRQADFRRHYTNVHAPKKYEFFCTHRGCDRSKRPAKKGKGRSFGSRRDKMEEHVRTVHEKESKRKNGVTDTEDEDDDDGSDEVEVSPTKAQKKS